MDYEKLYKDRLERAREIYTYYSDDTEQLRKMEYIFPELAESKDEKIRKTLLESFEYQIKENHPDKEWLCGVKLKDIVDWLEKQGTLKSIWHNEDEEPKRDSLILLIMQSGTPVVAKIIEPNHTFNHGEKWAYIDDLIFNQGEQKPANKVEPKFHEGDWITNGRYNKLIVGINSDWPYYIFEDGTSQHIKYIDKKYHLWTIADAKPGDVLTSSYGQPFIYNGYYDSYNVGAYGGLDCLGDDFMFSPTGKYWTNNIGIHPATKEQRDLLFQKMHEAGYEWNKEKKELKEIVVPIFNIGDTIIKKHNSDINKFGPFTITDISNGKYWYDESIICGITEQDDWELIEQKSAE